VKAIHDKEFPFFSQMKRYCKTGNGCPFPLVGWMDKFQNPTAAAFMPFMSLALQHSDP
jgi:hypothetical protein